MFFFNERGVRLHHYFCDFLWSYLSFDSNDPSLRPLLLLLALPIVPTAESLGLPHRPRQLIQTLWGPDWRLMHALDPLRGNRGWWRRWWLWIFRCPAAIVGRCFLIANHGVIVILVIRDQVVVIEVLVLVFLDNKVLPRDELLLLRKGLREGWPWNQWGQIWWGTLSVEDQGVNLLLHWVHYWQLWLRLLLWLLLLLMRIGSSPRSIFRRSIIIYLLLWFVTHLLLRSSIENSLNVVRCGSLVKRFPEENRFFV